jgi:hypothetical protein
MKVNLMNGFDQDDQPVCFIEIYRTIHLWLLRQITVFEFTKSNKK